MTRKSIGMWVFFFVCLFVFVLFCLLHLFVCMYKLLCCANNSQNSHLERALTGCAPKPLDSPEKLL